MDAAQGGDTATYGDYLELLERPDLHGVLIASPEHWHAQMAEDAIEAGKDVYVEKPMTLNLKDALRLQKVVRENPDAILVRRHAVRDDAQLSGRARSDREGRHRQARLEPDELLPQLEGRRVELLQIDPAWKPGVNVDWKRWCGPLGKATWSPEVFARWRRYRKYSTGIIGDLLVHHMTPTILALDVGWPVRVVASGGHYIDKKMENHDQVNLTVEFEREHTMIVAGSTCNELGVERVIRGHKGNLYVGGRNAVLRPERIYADEIEEREIAAAAGRGRKRSGRAEGQLAGGHPDPSETPKRRRARNAR